MRVVLHTGGMDEVPAALFAFAWFEDERPPRGHVGWADWRTHGALTRHILDHRLSGGAGEAALVTPGGALPCGALLLYGLGARERFTLKSFEAASSRLAHAIARLSPRRVVTALPGAHPATLYPRSVPRGWRGEPRPVANRTLAARKFVTALAQSAPPPEGSPFEVVLLDDPAAADAILLGLHQAKVSLLAEAPFEIATLPRATP